MSNAQGQSSSINTHLGITFNNDIGKLVELNQL